MNKKKFSTLIILIAVVSFIYSPESHAQEKEAARLEVEADPLAYILNGYSVHVGVTYGKFRSSIGTFGIKQPSFQLDNDAFSVYSSGFDLKTDYLFGKTKGFHAGLQLTYGKDKIGLKGSSDQEDLWGLNIGARGGYRFMFGNAENKYRGLYLNPWAALIYSANAKTISKGKEAYKQSSASIFPAVHVGWRF
ncbi:autotransporter domain-containing protein [Pedobacter sp. V48]|uniref:autotransporter domain-containing protein n=1 Tax=Pedobacter sp. V48 TaxID=509635 RepID=UPI0003E5A856|nr:autotransporter domain-containing protein [Pedobacter sp. V48]ETZ24912.1 hypothetical protein N824_01385 [Pedobacter sp. V48]